MHAIRGAALVAAVVGWWWASSVFTPWAADTDARLWLYDTLFYARFALLAWGLAEFGLACMRRRARAFVAPVCAAVLALIAWTYEHADIGLRFKVRASEDALARSASMPYETPRHRAGHFLVDTVRMPCEGEAWLWLGRPFGGGTGTSRALVQARREAPLPPNDGAYAFTHVAGRWWLATMQATAGTRPPSHPDACAPTPAGSSTPPARWRGVAYGIDALRASAASLARTLNRNPLSLCS